MKTHHLPSQIRLASGSGTSELHLEDTEVPLELAERCDRLHLYPPHFFPQIQFRFPTVSPAPQNFFLLNFTQHPPNESSFESFIPFLLSSFEQNCVLSAPPYSTFLIPSLSFPLKSIQYV